MGISASDVMKLRKMSGQGMMDCKKALAETNGDIEDAMLLLRKKGLATMAKRAGRDTSEGVVLVSSGEGFVALASLCCETDFASKSEGFAETTETMKSYIAACDAEEGGEALAATVIDGKAFSEVITDTVSKTGEKTEIGDYIKYKISNGNIVGSYVHFNNKVGALVEVAAEGVSDTAELLAAANDAAMHATAAKPVSVDRSSVDPELIAKERELAAEQMKNKPAEIIEKIVDGKMGKFFADNCLVDQKFVKNEEVTVGKMVSDAAKKSGGTATIKRFMRFEIC